MIKAIKIIAKFNIFQANFLDLPPYLYKKRYLPSHNTCELLI